MTKIYERELREVEGQIKDFEQMLIYFNEKKQMLLKVLEIEKQNETFTNKGLREYYETKLKIKNYEKLNHLRPAKLKEYVDFLKDFFAKGEKPTHVYSYNFNPNRFYTAKRDTVVPDGCGAMAFNVIALDKHNVTFEGKEHNHGNIYGKNTNPSWVPLYRDVIIMLEKDGVNIPNSKY